MAIFYTNSAKLCACIQLSSYQWPRMTSQVCQIHIVTCTDILYIYRPEIDLIASETTTYISHVILITVYDFVLMYTVKTVASSLQTLTQYGHSCPNIDISDMLYIEPFYSAVSTFKINVTILLVFQNYGFA